MGAEVRATLRNATSLALLTFVLWSGRRPSSVRADPPPDAEWEREAEREIVLNPPLDPDGVPTTIAARVEDAATGRGIAGARVDYYPEKAHPVPGVVPPAKPGEVDAAGAAWHRRTGWTDGQGWARIDLSGVGKRGTPWVFAEAPGFAPGAEYSGGSQIVLSLRRGYDVPIEVRDAWDRPLPRAEVALVMGCGHTPELRGVVTDEAGRAIMEGINPRGSRCWIRHERAEAEYHDLGRWAPGAPPLVLRCRPGRAVEGRVLDAEGRPVGGAFVGWPTTHHGPWAETDATGHFRLLGIPASGDTTLNVELGDPPVDAHMPAPDVTAVAPPEGIPLVVRLPPPSAAAGSEEPEAASAAVTLEVVRPSGERAEPGYVVAVRRSDGKTFDGSYENGPGSLLRLHLPPGDYLLRSWETEDPSVADTLVPQDLVVSGLEPRTERCVTRPRRPYRIVVRGRPQGSDIWLDTAAGSAVLDSALFDGGVFHAPAEGPVGLTLESEGGARRIALPADGMAPDAKPLEVIWDQTRRVQLRFVSPDGKPVPAVCTPWDPTEDPVLETPSKGEVTAEPEILFTGASPRWIYVRPRDPAWLARYVALPAIEALVKDEAQRTIRVEPRGTRRLTIVRADGSPSRVVKVTVSFGARSFDGFPADPTDWSADEDPEGLLRPGATVRVEAMDVDAPIVATLEGSGPWTVTIPSGSITVRVSPDGGEDLEDVTALFDGAPQSPSGATEKDGGVATEVVPIRGVAAGPHDLVVSSPGRRSRLFHVILKDGEARTLTARLRKTPATK